MSSNNSSKSNNYSDIDSIDKEYADLIGRLERLPPPTNQKVPSLTCCCAFAAALVCCLAGNQFNDSCGAKSFMTNMDDIKNLRNEVFSLLNQAKVTSDIQEQLQQLKKVSNIIELSVTTIENIRTPFSEESVEIVIPKAEPQTPKDTKEKIKDSLNELKNKLDKLIEIIENNTTNDNTSRPSC